MSPEPACDAAICSVEVAPQPVLPSAAVDLASLRQLVRATVWRGGCLDDPWRHAYLRARWFGQELTQGLGK
jgi:hypothetical protein